jgi:hypothetical protein
MQAMPPKGTRKEEDPFVGDLNNWEFLTVFFDHDDFLSEQIPTPSSTSEAMDEKPNKVFSAAPMKCRADTLHQGDWSHSTSGYPVSKFITQTSSVVRLPSAPLGDYSHHPNGILSNFSMSFVHRPSPTNFSFPYNGDSSLHRQEQQAISDLPSRHYDFLPPSTSSSFPYNGDSSLHRPVHQALRDFPRPHCYFQPSSTSSFPHKGNFGIAVPGDIVDEPIRYNRAAERLNVRRVPMDIVGCSNETNSSGQITREFVAPCQSYSYRCTNGTVTHCFLTGVKSSRDCLNGNETRFSMKKEGLFFDYSPPLPSHDLLKPLTAYNYFYRDERDNIIGGMQTDGDPIPPALSDFSETNLRRMLNQRWYIDPGKKKRSHRKTHGKLPFET